MQQKSRRLQQQGRSCKDSQLLRTPKRQRRRSVATHFEIADRLAGEIELNVGALTRLSHAALAVMIPRGRGWLLNVSSVAAIWIGSDRIADVGISVQPAGPSNAL